VPSADCGSTLTLAGQVAGSPPSAMHCWICAPAMIAPKSTALLRSTLVFCAMTDKPNATWGLTCHEIEPVRSIEVTFDFKAW
jgi:hypothetical protein